MKYKELRRHPTGRAVSIITNASKLTSCCEKLILSQGSPNGVGFAHTVSPLTICSLAHNSEFNSRSRLDRGCGGCWPIVI